jgi:hypothetical protein
MQRSLKGCPTTLYSSFTKQSCAVTELRQDTITNIDVDDVLQCHGTHLDGVDSEQAVIFILHERLQSKATETRPEALVHFLVTGPQGLQALLVHDRQRLTQSIPVQA